LKKKKNLTWEDRSVSQIAPVCAPSKPQMKKTKKKNNSQQPFLAIP